MDKATQTERARDELTRRPHDPTVDPPIKGDDDDFPEQSWKEFLDGNDYHRAGE